MPPRLRPAPYRLPAEKQTAGPYHHHFGRRGRPLDGLHGTILYVFTRGGRPARSARKTASGGVRLEPPRSACRQEQCTLQGCGTGNRVLKRWRRRGCVPRPRLNQAQTRQYVIQAYIICLKILRSIEWGPGPRRRAGRHESAARTRIRSTHACPSDADLSSRPPARRSQGASARLIEKSRLPRP